MLFPGFYRCDRCGHDVERIERYKGWRLCPRCVAAIVPSVAALRGGDDTIVTETQRQENLRFVKWDSRRRRWRPKRYSLPGRGKPLPIVTDDYFPFCGCGGAREPNRVTSRPRGLFGGPFHHQCPTCEAKGMVESTFKMADKIHPDWDDEEWLDLLYKTFPGAFEVGVLPDYWYELSRNGSKDMASRPIRAADG